MENITILSPGKKLRKIRKEFKIRQHEITGGEITRNLISIIENDKANLTANVANILAENINRVCQNKGFDFRTSPEYLLESENTQANNAADKFIEYLNKNNEKLLEDFEKNIEEFEMFLGKYDIYEKKVAVYHKIGDIFINSTDYLKAYTYYIKAYENSSILTKDKNFFWLIEKIGRCCILLKKYKEALDFNSIALKWAKDIPRDIRFALLFNNILIHKNLNEFDKALDEIEYIENNYSDLVYSSFDLLTLKANCLKQKKLYTDALEIHKYIYNMLSSDKLEQKLIAICNMLEIYLIINDLKNIRSILNKCERFMSDYEDSRDKTYSAVIYYDLGISYKAAGRFDMAKLYLFKSIKAGKKYNYPETVLASMDELFDICMKENDDTELLNLKNMLLELISIKFVDKSNTLIFKFIDYYNNKGDKESITGLVNFLLKEYE